jgi:NADP-dependent 3-hydroxy acid dehydrogenase YdfG
MGRLDGKVAIVTGASSGIGMAIAKAVAAEGAAVVLAGRTMPPMEEAAKEIAAKGGKAIVKKLDVTDEKAFGKVVDEAVAELGKLDIMVNNAGYNPFDTLIDGGDYAKWKQTLEVNVLGVALGCREAVRVMKGKTGHIVNITSVAARYAEPETRSMPLPSTPRAPSLRASASPWPASRYASLRSCPAQSPPTSSARCRKSSCLPSPECSASTRRRWAGSRASTCRRRCWTRTAVMAKNFVMRPEDIAGAVLYALCVPDNVQVSEIMIRPLQPLQMPGMRLPA